MLKKKIFWFVDFSIFISAWLVVPAALAQSILNQNTVSGMENAAINFADENFNTSATLGRYAELIISGFLSILGIIFIILIISAGFNWMTAAGDESKVTKAKETIYRAVMGLIIIVAAYAITYFVFSFLPFGGNQGRPVGG